MSFMARTSADSGALVVTLSAGAIQGDTGSAHSFDFGVNTASVSGGSGSYSYLWTSSASGNGSWTLSAPTAAATDVKITGILFGTGTSNVTCTVTDLVSGRTGAATTNYSYLSTN